MSQSERSLKGVFCAIDTACGMESVIQKLANSASGSVNLFHDSWGNTGWVTKRLIVAAPRARSAWKEGRRELVDDCTFRWLKMPLALYIPTTQAFCPRFCPTTSVKRTKLKDKTRDREPATRLDIFLGQLLDSHTLATCILHNTLSNRQLPLTLAHWMSVPPVCTRSSTITTCLSCGSPDSVDIHVGVCTMSRSRFVNELLQYGELIHL